MDPRAELEQLRKLKRLQELEAKAAQVSVATPPTASQSDQSGPSLVDVATGPATVSDWATGRIQAAKDVVKPEFWKGIGSDLVKPFPEINDENLAKITNPSESAVREMSGVVLGTMPVTKMADAFRAGLRPALTGADIVKQKGLEEAGKAGYSVPRSNIKQTWLTNIGERFGGKQAIEATAQMKNQPITNKLAAKALGLSDDVPITRELLEQVRSDAGSAYEVVKGIGKVKADKPYMAALDDIADKYSGASKDFPELANESVIKLVKAMKKGTVSADGALEQVKNLRYLAKANYRSLNPTDRALAKAQDKTAKALDDLISRNAEPIIGKDAFTAYQKARELIAKTHTIEKSLNESTGNVSAQALAKELKRGAPLSGELRQAAKFGQAFPRLGREPIGAPPSGGMLEPLVYGVAGGSAGGPAGILASGIPIIGKPIARHLMTKVPKTAMPQASSFVGNEQMQALARLLASFEAQRQ